MFEKLGSYPPKKSTKILQMSKPIPQVLFKKKELVNCEITYLKNHIDYTRYLLIYLKVLPKEALAIIKEK
jgi:hypothetical protein